ncbi:uncharacterized protein LOC116342279 [Contarinia nasturtii]|uniref:uncharacterized protein LOC116342279 n=1 Tax=Contarinia nasturtii TaxID=265458 RepID=UPI0012D38417|nr:uncharacterized protein LOC116342279 [Contarinia nasturtii]
MKNMNLTTIALVIVILAVASMEATFCGRSERENESPKSPNEHTANFVVENCKPFIILWSNITIKPVKLMIDTGATLTVVASDLVNPDVLDTSDRVSIYGIAGPDAKMETLGVAHSILSFSDHKKVDIEIHAIDKKYIRGLYDGYFGNDLMIKYKMKIDTKRSKLIFRLNGDY